MSFDILANQGNRLFLATGQNSFRVILGKARAGRRCNDTMIARKWQIEYFAHIANQFDRAVCPIGNEHEWHFVLPQGLLYI